MCVCLFASVEMGCCYSKEKKKDDFADIGKKDGGVEPADGVDNPTNPDAEEPSPTGISS